MKGDKIVSKYVADQVVSVEEILTKGMEARSKQFAEEHAEVYAKV